MQSFSGLCNLSLPATAQTTLLLQQVWHKWAAEGKSTNTEKWCLKRTFNHFASVSHKFLVWHAEPWPAGNSQDTAGTHARTHILTQASSAPYLQVNPNSTHCTKAELPNSPMNFYSKRWLCLSDSLNGCYNNNRLIKNNQEAFQLDDDIQKGSKKANGYWSNAERKPDSLQLGIFHRENYNSF